MSGLPAVLAQAGELITPITGGAEGPTAGPVPTPSISWEALLPLLILGVGGLLLLTITSLVKGRIFRSFYAVYTIAVASAQDARRSVVRSGTRWTSPYPCSQLAKA